LNNQDRQVRVELTVFREFAKLCPLPLDSGTARPGPDPPDILCELESGETLAFELVSCEDEVEIGVSCTKKQIDAGVLNRGLEDEFKKAVKESRIERPERFKHHSIWVDFSDDATLKKRKNAMPRVCELLNQLGPGCHAVNEPPIQSIRCIAFQNKGSYAGPEFCVSTFCCVGVCIVEHIKAKLDKKYSSDRKLHLIAWSITASAKEFRGFEHHKKLVEMLKERGMDPFDHIWVFGVSEKSIIFDSAMSAVTET
jgi:hypothetical protein